MNNPSPNYPTCQKCGTTLRWVCSIDGGGSYCETCAEVESRKSEPEGIDVPHCPHKEFRAAVDVARLEDSGRFMADVRVSCSDCGVPFTFQGLPVGLNLEGCTVSADGQEARLSIQPAGDGFLTSIPGIRGVTGYWLKPFRREGDQDK